jgi:hypothetical protein
MKKGVITQSVQVALRTLDEETRRRVNAWFEHLANWDGDELPRNNPLSRLAKPWWLISGCQS